MLSDTYLAVGQQLRAVAKESKHSSYPGQVDGWNEAEGDDILEQGKDVAERGGPGWFPGLRWRPSRGAVILGATGLVLGLVAGYAAAPRPVTAGARQVPGPAATTASASGTAAPAASRATTAIASGSPDDCGPSFVSASPVASLPAGNGQLAFTQCVSSGGNVPLVSLAVSQTTAACSVQLGHELQLGVEVSNQTSSDVTLRQVVAALPLSGGLQPVGWAWGPCGAISSRAGQVAADLSAGEDLSPGESGWFTMTFRVLVKCPGPYPVQFIVRFDSNGRTSAAQVEGFNDLGQVQYSGCAGS